MIDIPLISLGCDEGYQLLSGDGTFSWFWRKEGWMLKHENKIPWRGFWLVVGYAARQTEARFEHSC